MRLKRFFILFVQITSFVVAFAQTQQGYVKTLGRPDKKGEALSGVSVRVKGGHNAVLSKTDGTFSVLMSGKRNGDAYSLQQVQKSGYELNEQGVIGRQYAFSDRIPLTIVMVSTAQLQADKQRIENNAYQVAERNYKARLAQLEKQKEDNTITIEEYRNQLQDLQDKFDKYQSLIDGLADHYAHVDYDNLDEKEREINLCIENGELERADSLLHTLFDPTNVLKRNKDAIAKIEQQESQARDILAQANANMAKVLKQQEKDAEYLYQLYTIALAKFDNDKARFYLETRAALDTMNVDWQSDAGDFLREYLGDYGNALIYQQRALCNALLQYGEESKMTATAYANIGAIYIEKGEYLQALDYLNKPIPILEKVLGLEHPDVATSYSNLGMLYDVYGDYSKAQDLYIKALVIREKSIGMNAPNTAISYNNVGGIYFKQGDFDKALEYFHKALAIQEDVLGSEHRSTATSYNNIGVVYFQKGDVPKAVECFLKTLSIQEQVLGDKHPDLSASYSNLGMLYSGQGDYSKALDYLFKALRNDENAFGVEHSSTAISYGNIGAVYIKLQDYSNALNYLLKALSINEKVLGPSHPSTAISCNNIGLVYLNQGEYTKALEYFVRALTIRENVLGVEHPSTATSYNNIGGVYLKQGDYSNALKYFSKALAIREKVLGDNHPDTKDVLKNIHDTKNKMKQE